MFWLNPAAWIALAAVAAPILIHIFVQRKSLPLPFPTLRFLLPTRLSSVRRRMLDDLPLLAVRAAVIAAAAAAFAGPLLVTAARRQLWNARVTRAFVVDRDGVVGGDVARPFEGRGRGPDQPSPRLRRSAVALAEAESPALREMERRVFETRSLPDGIRRARIWLDSAPPSRREIAIVSPLALGSLTAEDVAAIPADIGVRFERTGTLPESRTVDGADVLGPDSRAGALRLRQRVTLTAGGTAVRGEPGASETFPIDVIASPFARGAVERAIGAVVSRHVWAPADGRRATFVIAGSDAAMPKAEPIQQPWMADAVARIAVDGDLIAVAARTTTSLDPSQFDAQKWVPIVRGAEGRPLASAASADNRLLVVSAAEASNFVTPVLLRAMANALADPPDLRSAEVLPIPDAQLRAWTRAPGPLTGIRSDTIDADDRRWLWVLVLVLIGIETWMRCAHQTSDFELQTSRDVESPAHVA